jgi:hypothetical protein
VVQRFAACAERWAWSVIILHSGDLQVLRGMAPGSLRALKHMGVFLFMAERVLPPDDMLSSLVSAAPNVTTLALGFTVGSSSVEALAAMLHPLRQAAHLRTLWLTESYCRVLTAAQQEALLEGVVRCLVQPCTEGGDEYCRALRHVLLDGAQPDALAACRAALARDGICVSVDTCGICIE